MLEGTWTRAIPMAVAVWIATLFLLPVVQDLVPAEGWPSPGHDARDVACGALVGVSAWVLPTRFLTGSGRAVLMAAGLAAAMLVGTQLGLNGSEPAVLWSSSLPTTMARLIGLWLGYAIGVGVIAWLDRRIAASRYGGWGA